MDGVQSSGRLVAGVSYDIPGMGYPNPRTGRIDGFEADLARALWEKLFGAPGHIELAQVTDMVLSQLTITPDRAEQVDFSIPYWVTREGILVRKESGIKGFDDLKGKRIVITAGSLSLRRMRPRSRRTSSSSRRSASTISARWRRARLTRRRTT
jgi:putative glutamine transport system substrate-binding protein